MRTGVERGVRGLTSEQQNRLPQRIFTLVVGKLTIIHTVNC